MRTHPCAHVQFHFQYSRQVAWCIYPQGIATSESRKELAINATHVTPPPPRMAASQWKRGRSQVERKLKVERSIYEWVYVASSCFSCCQLESTPHSTGSLNDLFCVLWRWYLLNSLWNTYSSPTTSVEFSPHPPSCSGMKPWWSIRQCSRQLVKIEVHRAILCIRTWVHVCAHTQAHTR